MPNSKRKIIAFLTDFGLWDEWVAVCKAVIWDSAPEARIIDISHFVPDYDVGEAAMVLRNAALTMGDAIYLAVVDPEVGGRRNPVAVLANNGAAFVGPDNGLLRPAIELCGGAKIAVWLNNDEFRRHPVCPTFHARDIFAPAAAALAGCTPIESLGGRVPIETLASAPWGPAVGYENGFLAEVIGIDSFGSIRFNLSAAQLAEAGPKPGTMISLSIDGQPVLEAPFYRTYADTPVGEPLFLVDSAEFLCLACNQESAAEKLGIVHGQSVTLIFPS